jgi:two-component system response regulator MprA
MATHILIIDNDEAFGAALQRDLEAAGYAVMRAASSGEAVRLARHQPPDLAIVNLLLPGLDGLEACRRLWAIHASLLILPLIGPDPIPDDYLTRPVTSEAVLARIRRLRGRSLDEPRSMQFADLRLDVALRQARRGPRPISLTTTEYEVLHVFLLHPRQVLSRGFLYERVWGHDFEGESKVLELYIHYLRTKLEAAGEARLLHTVRGAGYILREHD